METLILSISLTEGMSFAMASGVIVGLLIVAFKRRIKSKKGNRNNLK